MTEELVADEGMPSQDRPDDFVDGMEREAEQRLERFAASALKHLGEFSGASTLSMRVWEPQEGRTVIHTKATNEQGTWRFTGTSGPTDFHFPASGVETSSQALCRSH